MKIYTKTGDAGETALFGGLRVSKATMQVEAYGSVDELTSFIGLLIADVSDDALIDRLTTIQRVLYEIMSVLSGYTQPIIDLSAATQDIEVSIDRMEKELPRLTRFILPQGNRSSSLAHVIRTVCRRAERAVVRAQADGLENTHMDAVLMYLNRLSDFFFVLARTLNKGRDITT